MWFQDTAIRDTSYCYLSVQSTMVPYICYEGYAHICMYTDTHYTLSQVYLAKQLPVLVSISLSKQTEPTKLKITILILFFWTMYKYPLKLFPIIQEIQQATYFESIRDKYFYFMTVTVSDLYN